MVLPKEVPVRPLGSRVQFFEYCSNIHISFLFFFFFNDPATPEIYTLSLHDALPISMFADGSLGLAWMSTNILSQVDLIGPGETWSPMLSAGGGLEYQLQNRHYAFGMAGRSEEHTSELQSRLHLVCRLLLEKKKNTKK